MNSKIDNRIKGAELFRASLEREIISLEESKKEAMDQVAKNDLAIERNLKRIAEIDAMFS